MRVHAYAMSLSVVLFASGAAFAATYDAYPGDNLATWINSMSPGDTLIVHSVGGNGTGQYGRWSLYGVDGNDPGTPEEEWITVIAADGEPRPKIYYEDRDKNLVNLYTYVRYFKLIGLEFDGGSDSIKMPTSVDGHHIVFEDLYMHNIGNTGINLSSCGDIGQMEIRWCEIHDTGSAGNGSIMSTIAAPIQFRAGRATGSS